MARIQCDAEVSRAKLVEAIEANGIKEITPDNWANILRWYRDTILATDDQLPMTQKRTFSKLRAIFVATVTRIAKEDRPITHLQQAKTDWVKYAEGKN
ncbi:MAG: hypothetical protein ACXABY_32645 [Candidatus Thorarchaeota archaeon]